jgi:lysophospholipase L1-like esterase
MITYIDGLLLLGPDDAARFFDGLHPDAEGTRILRSRLAPHLALS